MKNRRYCRQWIVTHQPWRDVVEDILGIIGVILLTVGLLLAFVQAA